MKQKSMQLLALADTVRNEVYAREAIAQGFELIAAVMRGDCACEDCGKADGVAGDADTGQTMEEVGFVLPVLNTTADTATATDATATGTSTDAVDETLQIQGA